MKREDITKLFEGATDEQVSALLDINSRDIGKAKGGADKLQADLEAASASLTKANEAIKTLEASKGDAVKLQAEIDRYRQADADRVKAAQESEARAGIEARFTAAVGERAFIHDYVKRGVLDDFGKALADKANVGKSDKDVFDALTRDKDYFASQNPPPKMGWMGDVPAGATDLSKQIDAARDAGDRTLQAHLILQQAMLQTNQNK